jgi:hypothetical protein
VHLRGPFVQPIAVAIQQTSYGNLALVRLPAPLLQAAPHRLAIQVQVPGDRRDRLPQRVPLMNDLPLLLANQAVLRVPVGSGHGNGLAFYFESFRSHRSLLCVDGWGKFVYHGWGLLDDP